ncbi:nickel/cobalt transporter [Larsenimonas suaedae]|uniref:Nickel/cobalt efflux system n=1 Tax=Larsenimonas suaedae TaxID=1851019 RepID=A0ABU1GXY7_9GAMM|nr:nickel/cobalt transporter [Larsenimonas suaedae]MCM2972795.1 nickel/cobalt transporter [Larsenimonas suaedae]MDR5896894.1 nickel/cobalt transporter [Larsenimonas suaedae]
MPRVSVKTAFWGPLFVLIALGAVGYVSGWHHQVMVRIVVWQGRLYHALVDAISALERAPDVTAWSALLGVSFGYGVFHAAGPGHGKIVLSTYLASQGGAWRRALGLSAMASLLQGLTAVLLIAVLVFGLGWLTREAMGSVEHAELASFLMVTLVGVWLCWRSVIRLRRALAGSDTAITERDRSISSMSAPSSFSPPAFGSMVFAPSTPAHRHSPQCGCGHEHHIGPDTARDWRVALLTVLSIGVRPCSGAVLLLGAAALLDQFGRGVIAVFAMSLGTALTVTALALLSVVARDWVSRHMRPTRHRRPWAAWISLAGGALILALGLSLTHAKWQSASNEAPPMLGSPDAGPRSEHAGGLMGGG